MEPSTNPSHIPVFLHIPKNAGTYTTSWMQRLCRVHYLKIRESWKEPGFTALRFRRQIVPLGGGIQLSCYIYTPTDIHINSDKIQPHDIYSDPHTDSVTLNNFLGFVKSKDVELFSISVETLEDGYRACFHAIDDISREANRPCRYFTFYRDPFDRAKSLFCYINSTDSAHEPTHNKITEKDFMKYIASGQVEDCWFMRKLLDMTDQHIIEPYHLTRAFKCLDHFLISDMSHVDETIDDLFYSIYNVRRSDASDFEHDEEVNRNSTSVSAIASIKIDDLPEDAKQSFLDRTYWDRQIWDRYCANITSI